MRYNITMKFIHASDWHPAIAVLQDRIEQELIAGKSVLWLVSGGSNIAASVHLMQNLDVKLTSQLTIMPVDERYGPVGHEDSNISQLLVAGFDPKRAKLIKILQPDMSFQATADRMDTLTRQAFTDNEIIVGQLGMGADGHIAGILPHSPAVGSPDFVAAYDSQPYLRITLTHHALKRLSAAYVLAFGVDKQPALDQLAAKMVPYADQPAQILKELPEAYVFSDELS